MMLGNYSFKFFVIPTLLLATVYLILVIYLMNLGLVQDTLFGDHTINYKVNLMIALLGGMWTAMTGISLITLIILSLLTGANIALLAQRIKFLRSSGKMQLIIGGSSLFGIIGSGCASCGLPILSLLGVTGSLTFLPINGEEISLVSILLLGMSLYFLLKSKDKVSCELEVA